MKLVLYSGGSLRENRRLDREVEALLGEKALITFVPAEAGDAESDFADFCKSYTGRKLRFRCQVIDKGLTPEEEEALFESDAIFLGGGNTYFFLKNLKDHRLLPKFRRFVKKGGLLMGLSAGSILMTPTIRTAAVPTLDSDSNEVGLRDFSALGLVPFEFSPHYISSKRADQELLSYSRKLSYPIYACEDGQGIVVKDGDIQFVGQVSVFHNGTKFRMH